jgi:hypothetical protein
MQKRTDNKQKKRIGTCTANKARNVRRQDNKQKTKKHKDKTEREDEKQ